jgi:hypothetical protein
LQIHQAYFGAVGGTSHGQLASSLADGSLRPFLSAFTDRPGALPAGFALQPYLAATAHEDYYLICRTWSDTAVARSGMVFTHVLLLPLQRVPMLADLASVLRLLLAEPPPVAERLTHLAPLVLPETAGLPTQPVTTVPEGWLAVINQLVDQAGPAPVFVMSEPNRFQKLLEALWRGLPAPLRASLSWGIRFNPPAAEDALPLLVNVPDELAAKWRGTAVLKLEAEPTKAPATPIEQLLLDGSQRDDFRGFMERLEVIPDSFRSLKLCQRAYAQAESLPGTDADKLLALLRTIRQLQPAPDKALGFKQQVVQALASALAVGGEQQALGLRNVPIGPFLAQAERLAQAVGQVVARVITAVSPDAGMQENLLGYLADENPANLEFWWREAALSAFAQTVAVGSTEAARVVWLGIGQTAATRDYLLGHVPATPEWEGLLSKTVPASLTAAVADAVNGFSAGRSWWDLFAAVVASAYEPAEALRKQVKAERHLTTLTSPRVSRLAAKVADEELVALAVELPSQQLLQLAGEACGRTPALLAPMDVRQQPWRTIWAGSLRQTQSIAAGLREPAKIIGAFLGAVAAGQANDKLPLELIAASTYANVLQLPERAALWSKLPAVLQPKFVAATLDALVGAILAGRWQGAADPVLVKQARTVEFITSFLGQRSNDLAAVLSVNAVLSNLTDHYLKDYIRNLGAVSGVAAAQLGQFVALQRWKLSADAILDKARYNDNFRPALRECAGLFGWLEKFFNHNLFEHQVGKDDAWNALEVLMNKLYGGGPDQDNIWKRAGGDVTKLTNAQSRSEQWAAAIRLLRHGGGGKDVSAASLLRAARGDFKNNPELHSLERLLHLF